MYPQSRFLAGPGAAALLSQLRETEARGFQVEALSGREADYKGNLVRHYLKI